MNPPQILVIEPHSSAPAGALGDWLTDAGADLRIHRMPDDPLPGNIDGFDAVLCLDGPMSAQDDARHPWLPDVRRVLSTAVNQGLPTLGVCLGAQLLAVATGGGVRPGADGPEAGPALVSKRDAAWTDPLFAEMPLMQDVLQFHRDVIEPLPPQAELLSSAPRYAHQAFRVHGCAYGIQFHIETTPDIVRNWIEHDPEVATWAPEDAFEPGTLRRVHADIAQTWQPFARRFVDLAAGRLTPAQPTPRTLPMA